MSCRVDREQVIRTGANGAARLAVWVKSMNTWQKGGISICMISLWIFQVVYKGSGNYLFF